MVNTLDATETPTKIHQGIRNLDLIALVTAKASSFKINASLRAVPVYRKHLGRAGAWNIFWNNLRSTQQPIRRISWASVTMFPASVDNDSHFVQIRIVKLFHRIETDLLHFIR